MSMAMSERIELNDLILVLKRLVDRVEALEELAAAALPASTLKRVRK